MAQPCRDCLKVLQAPNLTLILTQWHRCQKNKLCTLHGVLISNPNVIFWLNAKQLISCNCQFVVNGGGRERSDRGWVFISSLHCWHEQICFVPRLTFLSPTPVCGSDPVLYQLCCAAYCLYVTKLCYENMASETIRLVFEKCKKQKPSFPLSDFAKNFGVHWTLRLS